MISNPAPDPKKSQKSSGSETKNPDPEQHCFIPEMSIGLDLDWTGSEL